ncbi:uncharacterized protein LOC114970368 [Acropora millepora]|uniref:uncharacterized protein LOC114970368 n=1 Tax=Acropora millepora TaxID=45264 RepID=UPI001CF3288D|nr:uncharacterized protein LOC114970368 [Acropora millepora]
MSQLYGGNLEIEVAATSKRMTDFKKKSTRFTEEMNRALIDGYTKKQVVLKSKFCNSVTNNHKKTAWEEITLAVNAVNTGDRKTVEQVKKRWEDMTTSVKKKERQARQEEIKRLKVTGNGNLPDEEEFSEALKNPRAPAGSIMSSSERQVADVLGPQAFVGITGGTDTLETLWVETSDIPPPSMANCSQDCVIIENENDGSSTSSVLSKDSSCLGDDLQIDKVTDALSNKKRKKTLSDAQLEVMANLFHTSGLVFT